MRFDPKYLPYKPKNVMAEEWIPQQEILGKYGYSVEIIRISKLLPINCTCNGKNFSWFILQCMSAHKNTMLFVSHCGMTGILEAIYHRVPIVGIANFADQVDNAIRIQDKGLGVSISKHNLNNETILIAIQEVLKNER